MIKDTFQLKKNSWHSRLMKFSWNLYPNDFSHLCPYFWIVLGSVLLFPFMCFGKGFTFLIEKGMDMYDRWENEKVERWYGEYYYHLKSSKEELQKFIKMNLWGKGNKKYRMFFDKLHTNDIGYWNSIDLHRKMYIKVSVYDNRYVQFKTEEQIRKSKIVRLNSIIKSVLRVSFFILALSLILLAIPYGYIFIVYLVHLTGSEWIHILKASLKWALFFGCFVLGWNYTRIYKYFVSDYKRSKISNILRSPFIFIWRKVVKLFGFLQAMIKEQCPAIRWID